ncbi:DUF2721 domain-containing protein [Burkholderiaceae bacterium DAT-1]|nr:DUF2721 domain-containing protein [Burkholderiaceae bacterium DAT-1]
MNIGVPALLFPAISLLLLAFTNRFLALSSIIRTLHDDYLATQDPKIARQIANLRRRVLLIRAMQAAGAGSMFMCVVSMFFVFMGWQYLAHGAFGVSLAFMMGSLAISLREIHLSSDALNILLADVEDALRQHED